MKGYITYFKNELIVGLQYRVAALAGLSTQFFWGFLYALIYSAFYSYANIDSINLKELMCYVWLNQAFFYLVLFGLKDEEITDSIKNGTVAYQLTRPYDLYTWWYLRHLSKRYSGCLLRFLPVIILAFILPAPYGLSLPASPIAFILFIVTLLLGTLIMASIYMIVQIIGFFTYQDKGITSIVNSIASLLSGLFIPLPLLPNILLKVTEYLPFRLIEDLPFRLYSGNITISYGIESIILQIIWIIILILIGRILMKFALKKVSVQGG